MSYLGSDFRGRAAVELKIKSVRQPATMRLLSHFSSEACDSPDGRPVSSASTLTSASRSGQCTPSPRPSIASCCVQKLLRELAADTRQAGP